MRRPLAGAFVAFGLLAGLIRAQDAPTPTDWDDAVQKAATHARYATRRAAAGRIAQAGDDAVPAIQRFEEAQGRAAIPLLLVDAIARDTAGGPATEKLLVVWATDREFYWRAQALSGLAHRKIARALPFFRAAVNDVSHLYRTEGALGLLAVGDTDADRVAVHGRLRDPDPRTRLRVALALLGAGDGSGAAEIVAAVQRADAMFLDDAWGAREATFALRELRTLTGNDLTAALGDPSDARDAARAELRAWAHATAPDAELPEAPTPLPEFVGGIEIRSCRNGDLFVRWTASGTLVLGLDPLETRQVPKARWDALQAELPALAGVATHGTVVCDYLRLLVPATPAAVHHKAAPSALPAPLLEWLKTLDAALDETGEGPLLGSRLGQFAAT